MATIKIPCPHHVVFNVANLVASLGRHLTRDRNSGCLTFAQVDVQRLYDSCASWLGAYEEAEELTENQATRDANALRRAVAAAMEGYIGIRERMCLECDRPARFTGEYPEDGELFCSKKCEEKYGRRTDDG